MAQTLGSLKIPLRQPMRIAGRIVARHSNVGTGRSCQSGPQAAAMPYRSHRIGAHQSALDSGGSGCLSARCLLALLQCCIVLIFGPAIAAAAEPLPPISQGYLYIEPYQVRFEAVFDAATILHWLEPQAPVSASLSAANQKDLTEKIAAKSAPWCRIAIDADPLAEAVFRGASIVKGKPGNTLPLDPGAEIATAEAMVGLVWELATPPIADRVTVEWKGFIEGQIRLPIRAFFGPRSEALEITSGRPSMQWRNEGRLRAPSALAPVPDAPSAPKMRMDIPVAIWLCVTGACLILLKVKRRRFPGGLPGRVAVCLLSLILMWPLLHGPLPRLFKRSPTTKEAELIIGPLLRNVYRAFDQRTESAIYDTLARSVHGELLRRLYLDTIQALTLDGREGTRVTITEFDATVKAVQTPPNTKLTNEAAFTADCEWTALGTVGHWGHTHTRVNRYTAQVTLTPIGKEWKITQLEVTESHRL